MRENSRVILSIEKGRGGSLYCLLDRFIDAYNRRTDAHARGLQAIALALSTPQDNSAQVQAEIDKYVAQLNAGTADMEDAIDQQKKEN